MSRRSSRDVPLLDRRLIADLETCKMMHPRSGNSDALFWPGGTPGSHAVDFSRVWDVASFRRNYLKPALPARSYRRCEYTTFGTPRRRCGSRQGFRLTR